jgi:hypothetical protein
MRARTVWRMITGVRRSFKPMNWIGTLIVDTNIKINTMYDKPTIWTTLVKEES